MMAMSPSSSAATASWADSPTVSRANATGLPRSSESRCATGSRLYLGFGRAVRATEVRADDDAGALVDEGVQRGERGPHTAIVRDDRVLERNVEVSTDDDTLAGQRTQRVEGAQSHDAAYSFSATYSVRSTRRFE